MTAIHRWRSALGALALGVILAAAPVPGAGPQAAHAESAGQEFGVGVGTVATNLLYMPAKVLYATGGGVVAGFAWLFSGGDADVTRPITNAAFRGDYVVLPDHLRGRRELVFVGRSPEQERAAALAEQRRRQSTWGDGPTNEGF